MDIYGVWICSQLLRYLIWYTCRITCVVYRKISQTLSYLEYICSLSIVHFARSLNYYIQRYIGCFHEKEIQFFKTLVRRKNRLDTKLMIHHLKTFYLVYFSSCYTHGRYRLLLHCLSNQDNSNLVNYLYDCTSHTGSNPCIHSNTFKLYLIL